MQPEEQIPLYEALMTMPGLMAEAAQVGSYDMAGATRLRRTYPRELVTVALTQAELRRTARIKFGADAEEMWFTRDGLEQASSTAAARHRAKRLCGWRTRHVFDLCCGIGGDLRALARESHHPLGVDLNPLHVRLARANSEEATLMQCDVREVDVRGADAVFVDPARRKGGQRMLAGEPPLDWCFALTEATPKVAVKTAPGIDLDLVPPDWEAEFVAVGADLKEAVLWSPGLRRHPRTATVLDGTDAHTLTDDGGGPAELGPVDRWLLDCNPAVGRAGVVDTLARRVRARKIDGQIAFLTSDRRIDDEFGRLLRVEHDMPFNVNDLRVKLRDLDVGAVDLRRRGLPGDVDQIRHKLALRGSRRITLVMTRVADQPWAIVCVEPSDEPLSPSRSLT